MKSMQVYHHTAGQLVEYVVFLALIGIVRYLAGQPFTDDEVRNASTKPGQAKAHEYAPVSENGESPSAYRLYGRKAAFLKTLLLTVCLGLVAFATVVEADTTWLNRIASGLHISGLVSLLWLDGVQVIGTSYQKKVLVVYAYLSILGGIDYFLAPTLLSLALFASTLSVLALSIFICFCNPSALQANPPTAEATANLWPYISFSYLNPVLIRPSMKKTALEFEDVPGLCDDDTAEVASNKFERIIAGQKTMDLHAAVISLVRPIWLEQGGFQLLSSCSVFCAPLALEKILLYVKYSGGKEYYEQGFLHVHIWAAVFILFLGPALKSLGDGQNYVRGRHIGVRVRAALIGSIYQKSLQVDLSASKESIGRLNNLISVDVGEIQNFWAYSHFMWSTPFEITIAASLLYVVLGKAAIAGIVTMVLFMVFGFYLGTR